MALVHERASMLRAPGEHQVEKRQTSLEPLLGTVEKETGSSRDVVCIGLDVSPVAVGNNVLLAIWRASLSFGFSVCLSRSDALISPSNVVHSVIGLCQSAFVRALGSHGLSSGSARPNAQSVCKHLFGI